MYAHAGVGEVSTVLLKGLPAVQMYAWDVYTRNFPRLREAMNARIGNPNDSDAQVEMGEAITALAIDLEYSLNQLIPREHARLNTKPFQTDAD